MLSRKRVVILRRNPTHEQVRIERRRRGHGQKIAGLDVDHHRPGTFFGQPSLRVILKPVVDGQLQIVAGGEFVPAQLAHHTATGIHLDPARARTPAQIALKLGLDPDLADLELRDLQQRVGVFQL